MSNVINSDVSEPVEKLEGEFVKLDVNDFSKFKELVTEKKITNILHLASLLSSASERNLDLAMKVNIQGMHNALNIAKDTNSQIFIPSSIASFGPNLEKKPVPDDVIQDPITFYGISKIYMEKLGSYYYRKFGTDFRSLRLPAIISPYEFSANGTASYPTELIHSILKNPADTSHTINIDPESVLPFMYISDCIKGIIELIEAGNGQLSRRVYNFNGLSFAPKEFVKELKKAIKFQVSYDIDKLKNEIAKTWPVSMDDKFAQKDWGWKPKIGKTKKLVEVLVKDVAELIKQTN